MTFIHNILNEASKNNNINPHNARRTQNTAFARSSIEPLNSNQVSSCRFQFQFLYDLNSKHYNFQELQAMMLGALEIVLIVLACVIVVIIIIFAVVYRFVKSVTNDTPDASTLISQVRENVNDKIILITGATSGIGKETVRVLSQAKCTIILAARNLEKANKLSNDLLSLSQSPAQCKFIIERLDLADLNQIKNEFLPNLSNNHNINKINMFLCNGGVYPKQDRAKTKNNNIELAFGVNFLAHMYLAVSLKPLLDAAATDNEKSRLIVTSSVTHSSIPSSRLPNVNSDINSNEWKKTYDTTMDNVFTGAICYGWSKLCDLWFVKQFHKLYDKEGKIIAVALHPGTGPTGYVL